MLKGLKKGDNVKVMTGKDRGKTGKIIFVDRQAEKIIVEGINMLTRHQRAKKAGQKGQKVRLPVAMHASKVMLVCPHTGKPTRVGFMTNEKGIKVRISKKSNKPID
ncbi:MAG: 50S ribosomal protein L24 [Candidatus Doudnabacteria bacterium CG10_big_fil_rev_8_21_14_0_10_41_10]|uniref:Large ribosomal subunit protein uL24 n=1 Tax=Candidatus Doudnabacteria bacterium CG10_big_fil_rev_8_21_14_0_10_41_10 TaxID=1974551 RepID=A0A2H0VDG6_9BACT|nr:MAG: 50S ribosomal protein L24 [Candidatus Doudnabacteria bacterium CG10_big_fil_rev_8_21_14_0_10_41_10]